MKYLKIILLPILFVFIGQDLMAQEVKKTKVVTDTLEVTGVCKMCKARIEEAAMYVPGVKMAEWTASTQQMVVVYKTSKTNAKAIGEAVAKVGHDNAEATSPDEAYSALPGCCKYRDGVKVH